MRDKRERCSGCGTRAEDWKEDRFAFVGHIDHCPGCETVDEEWKNVPDDQRSGKKVRLVPRAVGEQLMLAGEGML